MTQVKDPDEQLWRAVGDPSRRRVLDLLIARGPVTSTGLASELPFTRQAVTKHLVVLDRVGLVQSHRAGRELRYCVRPTRLNDASQVLARAAEHWEKQLHTIKAIAEAIHNNDAPT